MKPPYVSEFATVSRGLRAAREATKAGEEKFELNGKPLEAFLYIVNNPGSTASEIADEIGVASNGATRVLKALDEAGHGLITSEQDEQDRRLHRYYLTPAGKTVAEGILRWIAKKDVKLSVPTRRPRERVQRE